MNALAFDLNKLSYEQLLSVKAWQITFCDNNHCAAFLLSKFEQWHQWKLETDAYNKKLNDVAEQHKEPRLISEDVWLCKSMQALSDAIFNLFSIKTIGDALKLLEKKGVISIGANPNKKHCFDKRKYFRFYPHACQEWFTALYLNQDMTTKSHPQSINDSPLGNFTESEKSTPSCVSNNVLIEKLTERESQCLNYLARGKTIKEIAIALGLSPRTVETHLEKSKNKLNCYSNSELINTWWKHCK